MSDPVETRPRPRARRPRASSRTLLRLGVESVLIVGSVLLGFTLNEWDQRQRDRERAREVVANFRREVEGNLATLRRVAPKHEQMLQRLRAASERPHPGKTAFQVFLEQMPADRDLALAPLRDAAWETAVSTGALRLIPYELAASLSEAYLVQRAYSSSVQRLADRFSLPENFDPDEHAPVLGTHRMMFEEITGQEEYLIEIYEGTLQRLPPRRR